MGDLLTPPSGDPLGWPMVTYEGITAWSFLLGPHGWRGRTWFGFSKGHDGLVALPRLVAFADVDDEFARLLVAGVDPRALMPPLLLGPEDLQRPRVTQIRQTLSVTHPVRPTPVELPSTTLETLLAGSREHGRLSAVDSEPHRWVWAEMRALFGIGRRSEIVAAEAWDVSTGYRHLRQVRTRLGAAGVLPWGGWRNGTAPANWATAPEFCEALMQWCAAASAIDKAFGILRALDAINVRAA